ncbi:hypothetical protein AALP_AA8G321700 [Arabis alpina]|uniref:Phytocyanin domain-containing protein n=1 Tax=Arabis alpina TaxID=50452 RepID=A0A087GAV1_ARAAL|nr:hypothetical protein AALP_AA8G321700 [Arabis alpina]
MVMIMKSLCFAFVILASFVALFSVTDARRFNVGGNGVWAINPQENYNTWAEKNRFQVNDTLYFKYAKGSDSVQQVMKADFDGCNVRNPIKNFVNGESEVTLDRSGPFYFISGNQDHCKKGQKLIVVVLAVRNHPMVPISPAKPPSMAQPPKSHSPVSPAKSPSTAQPPKSHSPVAPAKPPTMAQSPKSPSPVAPVKPPTMAQPPKSSISPASSPQSSKTPSPISHSPAASPSHAPSVSPSTPSPSPKSPSPASSPSADQTPASPSPDQTPIAPSPEQTPPSSPSPADSTPASDSITAPAPSPKSSASGVAVTSVMTTLLSMAFIVFMLA